MDSQRRTLARVRGTTPVESYEPYFATFKSRFERMSTHYLGAGTREPELVSYDIKR